MKNQNATAVKTQQPGLAGEPEYNEDFEKKRAEACTALTNMASMCISKRLQLKEDNIDLEHTKKILNLYFEILLEKIDALKREVE